MKKLLLITYVDFWRIGSGHRTRISSMINYFKNKIEITVYFAGCENTDDRELLDKNFHEIYCEFSGTEMGLTFKDYKGKFKTFIKDKYFDFALIEYIELSIVLKYLPDSTITILDTHDIVFNRIKSFRLNNLKYDGIVLTQKEELHIYQCYDYVILIHKVDFENIAKKIDVARLLLVPHPTLFNRKMIREKVRNVGYVASSYQPNINALSWFINNTWDMIWRKYGLTLNIYGNIKQVFLLPYEMRNKNIYFHGVVDDLEKLYESIDIAINPIQCGAGLKIKNVEALGHSMPLITSTHGAIGMGDGALKAFLVANKAEEYLQAFDMVVQNYGFRKRLSESALEYAQLEFSEEKCYGDIFKVFI